MNKKQEDHYKAEIANILTLVETGMYEHLEAVTALFMLVEETFGIGHHEGVIDEQEDSRY